MEGGEERAVSYLEQEMKAFLQRNKSIRGGASPLGVLARNKAACLEREVAKEGSVERM